MIDYAVIISWLLWLFSSLFLVNNIVCLIFICIFYNSDEPNRSSETTLVFTLLSKGVHYFFRIFLANHFLFLEYETILSGDLARRKLPNMSLNLRASIFRVRSNPHTDTPVRTTARFFDPSLSERKAETLAHRLPILKYGFPG